MKNGKIDLMDVTRNLSQIKGVSFEDAMRGVNVLKAHLTMHQAIQNISEKLNSSADGQTAYKHLSNAASRSNI